MPTTQRTDARLGLGPASVLLMVNSAPQVWTETSASSVQADEIAAMRAAAYALRGESVSVGGAVDYAIRRMSDAIVIGPIPATEPSARRWSRIKHYINSRGLTDGLQAELQAVATYFQARQLAAHGRIVILCAGETVQIFRTFIDGYELIVEAVTLDQLQNDVAMVRGGWDALQFLGRTIDCDEPMIFQHWGDIARWSVIGGA